MLRDGLDGCGLGTGQTAAAGRAAWRSAAHDRCACCRKRHLLSVAHGLPMAPAATPVPTLGHGLPLLAELGAFWNLGAIAPRRLGTSAYGRGDVRRLRAWSSCTVNRSRPRSEAAR